MCLETSSENAASYISSAPFTSSAGQFPETCILTGKRCFAVSSFHFSLFNSVFQCLFTHFAVLNFLGAVVSQKSNDVLIENEESNRRITRNRITVDFI